MNGCIKNWCATQDLNLHMSVTLHWLCKLLLWQPIDTTL